MSQDTDHDARRDLSGAFGRPLTSSLRGLLPPRPASARGEVDGPDAAADEPDDEFDERDDEFDEPDDEFDEPDDEFDEEEFDDEELDGEPAPVAGPDRRVAPGPRRGAVSARAPERVPADPPRARAARPSAAARGTEPLVPSRTRRPEVGRPPVERAVSSPVRAGGSVNRRWGVARIASRDHVDLLVLLALDQGAGSGRDVIGRLRADSGDLLDPPEQTVHRTLHRLARNRLVVRRTDRSGRITYSLSETGRRSMLARVREWRALSRAFGAILSERSL